MDIQFAIRKLQLAIDSLKSGNSTDAEKVAVSALKEITACSWLKGAPLRCLPSYDR